MKLTPMEVRTHHIRKGMRGYDVREVEALREMAAETIEESNREIMRLEERNRDIEAQLSEHVKNEAILKETITTAQKMVENIKGNARKEAELIVAEARLHAEEIIKQAQGRASELQAEILRLRGQRNELNTSIRAIIDYHSSTLLLEDDESKRADHEMERLRFLPK